MVGEVRTAATEVKRTIRRAMASRLANMPQTHIIEAGKKAEQHLMRAAEFETAQRIALYLHMATGECPTDTIIRACFAAKKQVFVPSYGPRGRMVMLEVYSEDDIKDLPSTKWGIQQPDIDDPTRADALLTGGLDLVVIPGLAFSREGHRLGRGAGYYDRFLKKLTPNCHRWALCLNEQIVPSSEIPMMDYDIFVQALATPDGIFRCDVLN
eukprot:Clim_evm38s11 gene=Clim_evmTU38s11